MLFNSVIYFQSKGYIRQPFTLTVNFWWPQELIGRILVSVLFYVVGSKMHELAVGPELINGAVNH